MSKIAFMFPGQGSLRGRDGTRRRRGRARGDGRLRGRQRRVRARPQADLLPRPDRGAGRHGAAAAGARGDEPRDQRGDPRARDPSRLRRRALGRRVRRARRGRVDRRGRRDRARDRARDRDGRGGARSGRARWPRSSGSPTRSSRVSAARSRTSGRRTTTAPARSSISGEDDAVGECCAEAEREGARRAVRLSVSGAFHSPLVERAAERLRPAVEKIHFAEPRTAFMSTVTAKLEDAQRTTASCSSTS